MLWVGSAFGHELINVLPHGYPVTPTNSAVSLAVVASHRRQLAHLALRGLTPLIAVGSRFRHGHNVPPHM